MRRLQAYPPLMWLLALWVALFAVAPHQHFISHRHTGASQGHQHTQATLHQAGLEREVLAEFAEGAASTQGIEALSSSPAAEAEPQVAAAHPASLSSDGSPCWQVQSETAHTHAFSDPNAEATGVEFAVISRFAGRLAPVQEQAPRPALARADAPGARGPPRA